MEVVQLAQVSLPWEIFRGNYVPRRRYKRAPCRSNRGVARDQASAVHVIRVFYTSDSQYLCSLCIIIADAGPFHLLRQTRDIG